MDLIDGRPSPLHFADPRQRRIYERLVRLVGDGPASFYKDACRLLVLDEQFETTSNMVAHELREVESALRDILITMAGPALPDEARLALIRKVLSEAGIAEDDPCAEALLRKERQGHKAEIRSILKMLDEPEGSALSRAWFGLADKKLNSLHKHAHRSDLRTVRPTDASFRTFVEQVDTVLDALLGELESRFSNYLRILEAIMRKTTPAREDAKQIRLHMPNSPAADQHFFQRVDSPAWLGPLEREGFFSSPPEPRADAHTGLVTHPRWGASQYLSRMASIAPEEVVQILVSIETANYWVQLDILDAAIAMPPAFASELAAKVRTWYCSRDQQDTLLAERLARLMVNFAEGGRRDDALSLLRALLEPVPQPPVSSRYHEGIELFHHQEPRARISSWEYRQIIETELPKVWDVLGLDTFVELCTLLDDTIRHSLTPSLDTGVRHDHSQIWCSAIETPSDDDDSPQGHGVRGNLVVAIRDAMQRIVSADPRSVEELVRVLGQHPWDIFRRIEMHFARVCQETPKSLVRALLTNRGLFNGDYHEYRLLAHERFSHLDTCDQSTILAWIDEGPPLAKTRLPVEDDKDSGAKYSKYWRQRALTPIAHNLPEPWASIYADLNAELGAPPDVLAPQPLVISGFVGGPKSVEELAEMSIAEMVEFLRTWSPSEQDLFRSSPDALASSLTHVVAGSPERFAREANLLRGLSPTYSRGILDGFVKAITQKESLPWEEVLSLCHSVILQSPAEETLGNQGGAESHSARRAVADLLCHGLDEGPATIPYRLRNQVWSALLPLTDDPDPTVEEENAKDNELDDYTLAFNSVRGLAMEGVLRYAVWVGRNVASSTGEGCAPTCLECMPEVADVLNARLDPLREPTRAIRAVYGRHFTWLVSLDKSWAEAHIRTIFSTECDQEELGQAAWNSHLAYARFNYKVFEMLRDQYADGADKVGLQATRRASSVDTDNRLAQHLMIAYWTGTLSLHEPCGLLSAFFRNAPDGLRAAALDFVGKSLRRSTVPVPTEIQTRLQDLWESRVQAAREIDIPTGCHDEMSTFGWWFASGQLGNDWSLKNLQDALDLTDRMEGDYWVLERLAQLVKEHRGLVTDCLSRMIRGCGETPGILDRNDSIRTILSSALACADKDVKRSANQLANHLISRGFSRYLDLV